MADQSFRLLFHTAYLSAPGLPLFFKGKRSLVGFGKFMMRQRICFRIMDHIKIGNIRFRSTAAKATVNIALRYESSAVFTVFVSRHHVSFLLYFFLQSLAVRSNTYFFSYLFSRVPNRPKSATKSPNAPIISETAVSLNESCSKTANNSIAMPMNIFLIPLFLLYCFV